MTQKSEPSLYSHHIFLFPFKWDYLPSGKSILDASFSERTAVTNFTKALDRTLWEDSPFVIRMDDEDKYHTFNEYNYFHAYVRDALALSINRQNTTSRFRYKLPIDGNNIYYKFSAKKSSDEYDEYSLIVKDILLTTYDIGVGYMAFFLENRQTKEPDDILRINEFGRRIYPQYLGYISPSKEEDKNADEDKPVDAPKYSFLAERVEITGLTNIGEEIKEEFSHYNDTTTVNGEPYRLPGHISKLLGPKFKVSTRESKQQSNTSCILLNPVIDDRMFVQSYYFAPPDMMDTMRSYNQEHSTYSYSKNDYWYAYLFVDPSSETTCHSRNLKEQLLTKCTYDRWLEYKNDKGEYESQLFGISRYSFVTLVDKNWYTENVLINHHKYIYFQMMALALMQRAAVLRFAAEAANISEVINTDVKSSYQKRVIREIYKGYLYFTNKMYFREVTPQEQGIELYDKVRDVMEIDHDLAALQKEVEDLHQYAVLLDNEKSSSEAEVLTWVATIFLPPTLVAAIFGFSNFPKTPAFQASLYITVGVSALLILLLIVIVRVKVFTKKS